MARTAPDAERLVEEYTDLWSERDYSRIPEVVPESFVHATPGAPDGAVHGPDGLEAFMREMEAAFPDFEATVVESLVDGDTVMTENEFEMTHEGEFAGTPATGRTIQFRSMAICRVGDGELEEIREYLDMHGIHERLGAADDRPTE